jgi:hypothetical protein
VAFCLDVLASTKEVGLQGKFSQSGCGLPYTSPCSLISLEPHKDAFVISIHFSIILDLRKENLFRDLSIFEIA